jgi:hypothetical protein
MKTPKTSSGHNSHKKPQFSMCKMFSEPFSKIHCCNYV